MPNGAIDRAAGKPLSWIAGLAAFGAAMFVPDLAAAYVGPGAGLTAIGSALTFLGLLLLLVAGFLWYPAKRLLRRLRGDTVVRQEAEGAGES